MLESLTDLRIFVAAYEERSFTAAAQRAHATQSGVSQHVRKLERSLKADLFTRFKGQISPTPAADAYYVHCIEVLRTLENGRRAVGNFAGLSGDVRIGLMPTMTRATLAPALHRIVEHHPNVAVHVVEAYSSILTEKVLAAELDFAIVPDFAAGPGLKVRPFLQSWETLVAGAPRGFHLRPVRLRERNPLRLVVPSSSNTRRQTLEAYLQKNDVRVERLIELDSMMGALDLVATSEWVTIIPALMMKVEDESAVYAVSPIVDPFAPLSLVVIEPKRRVLSPAAQAVFDIVSVEATRLNDLWRPFVSEPPGA